ncbi:MAG: HEAT repeat domain-containing protein [Gemmatimonadaceae bacterium]
MLRVIVSLTITAGALSSCAWPVTLAAGGASPRAASAPAVFASASLAAFAGALPASIRPVAAASATREIATRPPVPWIADDPADSLYREARAALNRGQYRRAAETFRQIRERYPSSGYAPDALYWEAFALYRIGGTEELRSALRALDTQKARFANASTQGDAAELSTRIVGTLAARGDDAARQRLTTTARSQTACDRDEMAVRIEALNALARIESDTTAAILRRVLRRRDDCSAGLRKQAVFLLGRQRDPAVAEVLLDVARNDPDESVKREAVTYLSRVPGEAGVAALEQMMASPDERMQRTAVSALAMHESSRARQLLRALAERENAPEAQRAEAIQALGRKKDAPDDSEFLRGLYGRLTSQRLKETVLGALSRSENADNAAWLIALAKNTSEPMRLRATALSRFARSEVPIANLITLYDDVQERELKEQLMSIYGRRREPEAADKLIAIARTKSDPQLRRYAISVLSRKNDPRTTQLLMEILDQ